MCVLALAEEDGTVKAVTVFEGRRTLSRRLVIVSVNLSLKEKFGEQLSKA